MTFLQIMQERQRKFYSYSYILLHFCLKVIYFWKKKPFVWYLFLYFFSLFCSFSSTPHKFDIGIFRYILIPVNRLNFVIIINFNTCISNRWRFVIHAGIDGFSRLPTYIVIASDNTMATALKAFQCGVREYGLPEKVRTDKGRENMAIAEYMLQQRGLNSNSHITGRSVHNQR